MKYSLIALVAMGLAGSIAAGNARASELELAPVLLRLAPGQNSTTVEVRNRGGAPVTIHARPYSWTQVDDKDVLTPTSDLIMSPPIFTIPAGRSQTLRLLLRSGASRQGPDRSYRLILEEAPPAGGDSRQVQVTLRMSIPIFAAGDAPRSASPALKWDLKRSPAGKMMLSAVNGSASSIRVSNLEISSPQGLPLKPLAFGESPYILPGVRRKWTIEGGDTSVGPLRLSVTTNLGTSVEVVAP